MLLVLLLLIVIGVVTNVFMDKKNGKGDEGASTALISGPWDPEETRLHDIKSVLSWVSEPLSFIEQVSHQACALDWLVHQDTLLLQSVNNPDLLQCVSATRTKKCLPLTSF